jgi:REP element-mobilizing transposase RayT
MPRKKIILQSDFPYHITARCINKDWFRLDIGTVWSIFGDYLSMLKYEFRFEIISFVLMNNHYHLLTKTPEMNLSAGMNYFMREVSKEISFQSNRINQTFGGPYHWCLIDSLNYFYNTYKYTYRNPVEAGLSDSCESYPYSSLSNILGFQKMRFPISQDTLLFNPNFQIGILNWLNTPNPKVHEEISHALKKPIFRYRKNDGNKEPLISVDQLY